MWFNTLSLTFLCSLVLMNVASTRVEASDNQGSSNSRASSTSTQIISFISWARGNGNVVSSSAPFVSTPTHSLAAQSWFSDTASCPQIIVASTTFLDNLGTGPMNPWSEIASPVVVKSFKESKFKIAAPIVNGELSHSSSIPVSVLAGIESKCGSYAELLPSLLDLASLAKDKRYVIKLDLSLDSEMASLESLLSSPLSTDFTQLFMLIVKPRSVRNLDKRSYFHRHAQNIAMIKAFDTASIPSTASTKSKLSLFQKYVFVSEAVFMGLPVVVLLTLSVILAVHMLSSIQTPTKFEGKKKEGK